MERRRAIHFLRLDLKSQFAYLRGLDAFSEGQDILNALNPKKRVTLASKIGTQGQTQFEPDGLVFKEDSSTLYAANGSKVTV